MERSVLKALPWLRNSSWRGFPAGSCARRLSCALLAAAGLWAAPAPASWVAQNSGTNRDLLDVQFPVDADTGFVVGRSGRILKTTNGGATWQSRPSGTTKNLLAVHFPRNNTTGYAVGVDGVILKTTNGGTSWSAQSSGTTQHLMSVHFPVDASTGYAAGYYGTILKTTNGGATWTAMPAPALYLSTIYFPSDTQTGYVAGTVGTLGYVYKTVDGGQSWTQVLYDEDAVMRGLSFPLDAATGFAATWGRVWKTTNGAASWSEGGPGITESPVDIHFPLSSLVGFVIASNNAIFKTVDGGETWAESRIAEGNFLRAVHFVNNDVGYVVGDGGTIYKTTDGGAGNQSVAYLHPTGNGSVNGFSTTIGCAVHWDCVNDQPGNAATGAPAAPALYSLISDSSGHREMFALADGVVGAGQRITRIRVSVVAVQYAAPRISLSYQRMGIDPAPVDSPAFYSLPSEYCCAPAGWEWSGLNWTPAHLDALEIGVKHVSDGAVDVEQVYVKVYYEPVN